MKEMLFMALQHIALSAAQQCDVEGANLEALSEHSGRVWTAPHVKSRISAIYRDRPALIPRSLQPQRLFIPQRVNGIHPRCPTRRNITGSERGREKDQSRCREG
jgi:hypothetical protein